MLIPALLLVVPGPDRAAAGPGLPATGTSGLPVQVAAGLVLVGLGILVHRLARRRPAGLS